MRDHHSEPATKQNAAKQSQSLDVLLAGLAVLVAMVALASIVYVILHLLPPVLRAIMLEFTSA